MSGDHVIANGTAATSPKVGEFASRLDFMIANAALMRDTIGDGGDLSTMDALDLLAHAKKARRSMAGLERLIEDLGIAAMSSDGVKQVQGRNYTATLHEGGSRKEWRSQDLAGEVVQRLTRIETRKHAGVDAVVIGQVVREVVWNLLTVGRIEWRSRKLASLQLNADDYSKKEPGVASIEVRGDGSYDTWNPDQEQLHD